MVIVTLRPIADGAYKQWRIYPTTPTTHYDKVDEETPNDAVDYITSRFADGADHYVYDTFIKPPTGIPQGSTINSVTVYSRGIAVKTILKVVAPWTEVLLVDGTLYTGYPHYYTTWTTTYRTWATNPKTGSPWTLNDVEALEFGAYGEDGYDDDGNETWVSVTAVWMEIDYTPPVIITKKFARLGANITVQPHPILLVKRNGNIIAYRKPHIPFKPEKPIQPVVS